MSQPSQVAIPGPSYPAMDSIDITIEGVTRLLTNLNPNKASGPDKISNRFLKEFAAEFAEFAAESFLMIGKKAFVVLIFKKRDRSSLANHQPNSLASVIYKMLEHIISLNVTGFRKTDHIITIYIARNTDLKY